MTVRPEVWLPVVGYEATYEVSNHGRVRRIGGAVLVEVASTGGYRIVSLSQGGRVSNVRLSRIVLTAFCGEPIGAAQAAHNDGDVTNNALTNLRWATPQENADDVARHGHRCRGEAVHNAVLTEDQVRRIRGRVAAGERNGPLSEAFGVSVSTIHLIRHNRIWRHVA